MCTTPPSRQEKRGRQRVRKEETTGQERKTKGPHNDGVKKKVKGRPSSSYQSQFQSFWRWSSSIACYEPTKAESHTSDEREGEREEKIQVSERDDAEGHGRDRESFRENGKQGMEATSATDRSVARATQIDTLDTEVKTDKKRARRRRVY